MIPEILFLSARDAPLQGDIRGSVGVIVFLVWLWLAILALEYVIGLKIKEADRLHEMKYFDAGPPA